MQQYVYFGFVPLSSPNREAEPDRPLYHPCYCRGSIEHVHQDCLLQWLAASKNTSVSLMKPKYRWSSVSEERLKGLPPAVYDDWLFLAPMRTVRGVVDLRSRLRPRDAQSVERMGACGGAGLQASITLADSLTKRLVVHHVAPHPPCNHLGPLPGK